MLPVTSGLALSPRKSGHQTHLLCLLPRHLLFVVHILHGSHALIAGLGLINELRLTGFYRLMGVSGAGKTTLLDVLAQRTSIGVVTGDMLVNGQPLDASFQRKTGYVQQQGML